MESSEHKTRKYWYLMKFTASKRPLKKISRQSAGGTLSKYPPRSRSLGPNTSIIRSPKPSTMSLIKIENLGSEINLEIWPQLRLSTDITLFTTLTWHAVILCHNPEHRAIITKHDNWCSSYTMFQPVESELDRSFAQNGSKWVCNQQLYFKWLWPWWSLFTYCSTCFQLPWRCHWEAHDLKTEEEFHRRCWYHYSQINCTHTVWFLILVFCRR